QPCDGRGQGERERGRAQLVEPDAALPPAKAFERRSEERRGREAPAPELEPLAPPPVAEAPAHAQRRISAGLHQRVLTEGLLQRTPQRAGAGRGEPQAARSRGARTDAARRRRAARLEAAAHLEPQPLL